MVHMPSVLMYPMTQKMNLVTVRIYDVNSGSVGQKFLDLCLTSGPDAGKAKSIFDKTNDVLIREGIPWDNCIAFGDHNTNSNIGAKNSIKSRVLEVNASVYFVGCPCHIIHNVAQKAKSNRMYSTNVCIQQVLLLI